MMRFSDGERADDPLGRGEPPRKRTAWEQRARKALDTWTAGSEASVAVAIETAYADGLKRAATFIEENGQRELGSIVRKLTDEKPRD